MLFVQRQSLLSLKIYNATQQAFVTKDLVDLVLQNFLIAFSGLRGGGNLMIPNQ